MFRLVSDENTPLPLIMLAICLIHHTLPRVLQSSRFYPTENLFFSCVLPKGSEAEIAGFRVISSMILSWLPPLLFSLMVSNGIDPKVSGLVIVYCAALHFVSLRLNISVAYHHYYYL